MIADFLLARIAEDEAIAAAASPSPSGRWGRWAWCTIPQLTSAESRHIAQHDPARVMADCQAKRRVIEEHYNGNPEGGERCSPCDTVKEPCATLRALASVHADHPDFDPAWLL